MDDLNIKMNLFSHPSTVSIYGIPEVCQNVCVINRRHTVINREGVTTVTQLTL